MMKAKLILICIIAIIGGCLVSCQTYHKDDYRGYYKDRDHKEHKYYNKPKRDDE